MPYMFYSVRGPERAGHSWRHDFMECAEMMVSCKLTSLAESGKCPIVQNIKVQ